jgi:hypothetical protein
MKKFNALMIAAIVAVAFTARAEGTAAPEATKPAAAPEAMKADGDMKKDAKDAKHAKKAHKEHKEKTEKKTETTTETK